MADLHTDLTPIPFLYEGEKLVRVVIGPDGEPWFVAGDLCRILRIRHVPSAVERLDNDEKALADVVLNHSRGQHRGVLIVSEAGVYALIIRSRRPEAVPFRRWLTHEVIPSIRRTGGYHITQRLENLDHASARVANASLNAACRVVDTIRRTHGSLVAAKTAPQVLAKVGITIAGQPAQGELDLKVVGGTDI